MDTFDIFLSHNGADKPWAERLAVAIEADKSGPPLRVFFDKWEIPPGGDIPAELENGLQNSRYLGLVLSPEALSSDWVALERSTVIYRDPRARQRSLIPLVRRDCTLPDLLARLNHIDFRREQDFYSGLEALVDLIRGRRPKRGASEADLHFREDASLLRRQRPVFNRPAFNTSCIWELFLRELKDAIDDSLAAINTGALYSRSKNLMLSFPDANQYILPEFKEVFSKISKDLMLLKRKVVEFEDFFNSRNRGFSHHRNFYAMLMDSRDIMSKEDLEDTINYMDEIDMKRNAILEELNFF